MRGADQFHIGVIVDDLDAALMELTEMFGYEWCPPLAVQTPVVLADGEMMLDLRFTYSVTTPRVEVVQAIPGTLWVPAIGSGIHHAGYWSDDLTADSRAARSTRLSDRGQRGPSRRDSGVGVPPESEWPPDRAREPTAATGTGALLGLGLIAAR